MLESVGARDSLSPRLRDLTQLGIELELVHRVLLAEIVVRLQGVLHELLVVGNEDHARLAAVRSWRANIVVRLVRLVRVVVVVVVHAARVGYV